MKFIGFVIISISLASCASNIKMIDNYKNPQKALLVIDMQIDYIDEHGKLPIEISQINNLVITINNIIGGYNE